VIAMPDGPVTAPWEASLAALLPGGGALPGAFARVGAVHLSPLAIGFDATTIAWTDVAEVRTRRLRAAVTAGLADEVGAQAARLAPPGTRFAARKVATRLAAGAAGLVAGVFQDGSEVPWAVVARGRWRAAVHAPSAAARAVLRLPAVAASVLATARAAGVPVLSP
jgi:hypothetical protein